MLNTHYKIFRSLELRVPSWNATHCMYRCYLASTHCPIGLGIREPAQVLKLRLILFGQEIMSLVSDIRNCGKLTYNLQIEWNLRTFHVSSLLAASYSLPKVKQSMYSVSGACHSEIQFLWLPSLTCNRKVMIFFFFLGWEEHSLAAFYILNGSTTPKVYLFNYFLLPKIDTYWSLNLMFCLYMLSF